MYGLGSYCERSRPQGERLDNLQRLGEAPHEVEASRHDVVDVDWLFHRRDGSRRPVQRIGDDALIGVDRLSTRRIEVGRINVLDALRRTRIQVESRRRAAAARLVREAYCGRPGVRHVERRVDGDRRAGNHRHDARGRDVGV